MGNLSPCHRNLRNRRCRGGATLGAFCGGGGGGRDTENGKGPRIVCSPKCMVGVRGARRTAGRGVKAV